MGNARWRVAVTRDDESLGFLERDLDTAGLMPVSCPVLLQQPAPDPQRLARVASELDHYDWIICASARAVKPLLDASGSGWPRGPRTAAVGSMTAAAMQAAGAPEPVVGDAFNAIALLEKLRPLDDWHGRRILVTTVKNGRRELIEALAAEGAIVTEIEAYAMVPRPADDIRRDWAAALPDAVILGSAQTARHLIDAVGVAALHDLKAIVPLGPTTAKVIDELGIHYDLPEQATFASAVERLKSLVAR